MRGRLVRIQVAPALVLALAAWSSACNDEPPVAGVVVAAPPIAPAKMEPEVAAVTGTVERRAGSDEWVAVKVGDQLAADSAIRTHPNSSADLALGEESRITVQADSQVDVVEVTEAARRLKLKSGRLSVKHEGETGRVLRIEGDDGEVVEATGATFGVSNSGAGFAVATQTGTVSLQAAGVSVQVPAGQQAAARRGQTPSAAHAIPSELLLKVARAAAVGSTKICAIVTGEVSPGATVTVAGVSTPVAADGTFRATAARPPGRESVQVVVTDALGRRRVSEVACQTLPAAPKNPSQSDIEDLSIKWGSGGQKR